jgi:hypothetical protein
VGDWANWTFTSPSDTVVDGYTIYRHEVGTAMYERSRDVYWYDDAHGSSPFASCIGSRGCVDRGTADPARRLSEVNVMRRNDVSLRTLTVSAKCTSDVGRTDLCGGGFPGAAVWIYGAWLRLRDLAAPMLVDTPTGGLVDSSAPLQGHQVARITATDRGGGLDRAIVLVDGAAVGDARPDNATDTCREPYVVTVPCPLKGGFTIDIDTRSLPNGRHDLRLKITDVSGNSTSTEPVVVSIRNEGQPNGALASRFAGLTARLDRAPSSTPLRRTVSFGRRTRLSGRLADGSGRPISGAALDVSFRVNRPESGWKSHGLVTSDAAGAWVVQVPAGSSREIKVGYRAFSIDEAPSAEIVASVDVRARVLLSVKPRRISRKGRIAFAGRLAGGPGQRGTQVALYAVPRRGRARVPVAVLHADSRGHFHYGYRFTRTLGPTTYWFQAVVERQRGYPYAGWRSPRVPVRVG